MSRSLQDQNTELEGGALTAGAASLREQLYGLKRIPRDLKPRRRSHLKEREGGGCPRQKLSASGGKLSRKGIQLAT